MAAGELGGAGPVYFEEPIAGSPPPPDSMRAALLMMALTATMAGCSPDDGPETSTGPSPEVQAVLDHVGDDVIVATYADFDREAAALASACRRLDAAPSDSLLAAARVRWHAARIPWEQAEAFTFGPVTFANLDLALDSWPLNTVDIDATLAGTDAITPESVAALDPTTRGFHAAEYLLWGEDGHRHAADMTLRERDYLVAVAEIMARDAARVHAVWSGTNGYAALLQTAGEPGNTAYASTDDAVYELLMGVLFITEEVAAEKIQVTLQSGTDRFAESRYSRSSKADIENNLQSVSNMYEGTFGDQQGPGLSRLVAARDPALDARFRAELASARAAVAAIPGPLEDAVTEAPEAVLAAQKSAEQVLHTLEDDLIPSVAGR